MIIPNPDGAVMQAHEAETERRIAAALNKLRLDITRGVTADDAYEIVRRLDSAEALQPFTDAIIAALRDVALSGADFGRVQIEQGVFGIDG